ncbi:MAG: PEP-CTERM sorting domain-containing protein [Desulfomonilia bacterium]
MKKYLLIVVVFLLAFSSSSFASIIPFGDSVNYWPGWNNTTADDGKDTIGTPNILGGQVVVEGGVLQSVVFNYNNIYSYSFITPGDLFIDVNSDSYWDFVVQPSGTIYYFGSAMFSFEDEYTGTGDYGDSGYIFSDDAWDPPYGTWDIRQGHPVFYNVERELHMGTYSTTATVTNPFVYSGSGQSFMFSELNLWVGSDFTLGWTVSCANDVIYERVSAPVPEPTTLLLLGAGLIGLAGFRRKMR